MKTNSNKNKGRALTSSTRISMEQNFMTSNTTNSSKFEISFEIRSAGGETNYSSSNLEGGYRIYTDGNDSYLSIFEISPILTNSGTATSSTEYELACYLLPISPKVSIKALFVAPNKLKIQITIGGTILLLRGR